MKKKYSIKEIEKKPQEKQKERPREKQKLPFSLVLAFGLLSSKKKATKSAEKLRKKKIENNKLFSPFFC